MNSKNNNNQPKATFYSAGHANVSEATGISQEDIEIVLRGAETAGQGDLMRNFLASFSSLANRLSEAGVPTSTLLDPEEFFDQALEEGRVKYVDGCYMHNGHKIPTNVYSYEWMPNFRLCETLDDFRFNEINFGASSEESSEFSSDSYDPSDSMQAPRLHQSYEVFGLEVDLHPYIDADDLEDELDIEIRVRSGTAPVPDFDDYLRAKINYATGMCAHIPTYEQVFSNDEYYYLRQDYNYYRDIRSQLPSYSNHPTKNANLGYCISKGMTYQHILVANQFECNISRSTARKLLSRIFVTSEESKSWFKLLMKFDQIYNSKILMKISGLYCPILKFTIEDLFLWGISMTPVNNDHLNWRSSLYHSTASKECLSQNTLYPMRVRYARSNLAKKGVLYAPKKSALSCGIKVSSLIVNASICRVYVLPPCTLQEADDNCKIWATIQKCEEVTGKNIAINQCGTIDGTFHILGTKKGWNHYQLVITKVINSTLHVSVTPILMSTYKPRSYYDAYVDSVSSSFSCSFFSRRLLFLGRQDSCQLRPVVSFIRSRIACRLYKAKCTSLELSRYLTIPHYQILVALMTSSDFSQEFGNFRWSYNPIFE